MWKLQPTTEFERKVKKWPKKHRRELMAMLRNVNRVLTFLNAGVTIEMVRDGYGFVHPEPGGVLAIDQKGGGAGLKQTRLYIYPDTETKVLHEITLGDKRTQKQDIAASKQYVEDLIKKKREAQNG